MRAKILVDGFDGEQSYVAGDFLDGDGEFVRRMLANKLALPADTQAERFMESRNSLAYRRAALQTLALTLEGEK